MRAAGRAIAYLVSRVRAYSDPVGFARRLGVQVGSDRRILCNPMVAFGSEPYLVSIGDHVTVTAGVHFITHDGGVWVFRREDPEIDVFGRIRIGDNVFIGLGATLMPGVSVGDNCVIGAGAVVTRDIPSDCVAVGVPARPLRSIAEYRDAVEARGVRIRSLGDAAKREYLLKHLP